MSTSTSHVHPPESRPVTAANKYVLCFPDRTESWDPFSETHPTWLRTAYFGSVFQSLERHLGESGLTIYLTADETRLPSYGPDVVAVLQEDQPSRVPHYFDRVRATFTCHGIRQDFRPNPFTHPSMQNVMSAGLYAINLARRVPGHVRRSALQLTKGDLPPIYTIPLGYANQVDVPFKPLEERAHDVFFAGSVVHREGDVPAWRHWFRSPKHTSRERMVGELEALERRRPDYAMGLFVRDSFRAAISQPASWYSENMMDAKICPIPRGTSLESFRFFEALRAGCIPIVEALPSRWFYDDAPAYRVDTWDEAPAIIEGLLDNPDRLQDAHNAVRNWWETRCSEAAVGRYMAECLASS